MRAAGVSRGGYYTFLNRPKSSKQIAREALEPFVEDVFYASNRRCESRRIVVELRKIAIVANGKTAQRMMARKGLISSEDPESTERAKTPRQAVGREGLQADFNLMFHDGQGVQHTSRAFRRCLGSHGIARSMSRPDDPRDNALAESFF